MHTCCRSDLLICLLLTICCFASYQLGFTEEVSLPGCPSTCGDLTIPYPFGLGVNCAREGFQLSCNRSFNPPKTFIGSGDVELLNLSVAGAQARALYTLSYDCYSKDGDNYAYNTPTAWAGDEYAYISHRFSPYSFSDVHNRFTVIGCDTYAYLGIVNGSDVVVQCGADCDRWDQIVNGSCTGLGCDQVVIPKGLTYFDIMINSWNDHKNVWNISQCSFAFVVDKDWFTFDSRDVTNKSRFSDVKKVRLILDWVAGNESCPDAKKDPNKFACVSENSECYDSTGSRTGYVCNCSLGYEGNPYLVGGCHDVNECQRMKEYTCKGICENFEGGYRCSCPQGSHGDPKTYGCTKKPLIIILAVVIPLVFCTILMTCICGHLEKRKRSELAQKFYQQNGGIVLEQHMSTHCQLRSMLKVFTKEELEKATNEFDDSKLLGRGGQGIVYEGITPDNTKVAIKKSLIFNGARVDDFINEIIVLSQINHRNVVKLLGCCLEVEIPYLVYEFVPNNTLFFHIHNMDLPWRTRLRIAGDTAGALAHLHTKAQVPIFHQDVKSTNILLEMDYTAKLSDFGASKLVPTDEETLNTLVRGTLGYLDPEYLETHKLTHKSDVYSFGVVLVELFTGREPLSYQRSEAERCLANHFKVCFADNKLIDIMDPKILVAATSRVMGEVRDVAKLADRCLKLKGIERPSMLEVYFELEGMWRSGYDMCVEAGAGDETVCLLSEHRINPHDKLQSMYSSTSDNNCNTAALSVDVGR